jgi:hypothetical protein
MMNQIMFLFVIMTSMYQQHTQEARGERPAFAKAVARQETRGERP